MGEGNYIQDDFQDSTREEKRVRSKIGVKNVDTRSTDLDRVRS